MVLTHSRCCAVMPEIFSAYMPPKTCKMQRKSCIVVDSCFISSCMIYDMNCMMTRTLVAPICLIQCKVIIRLSSQM